MITYTRETTVTYIITDEVSAKSQKEAESLPITQEVPKGALIGRPIAIIKEELDGKKV